MWEGELKKRNKLFPSLTSCSNINLIQCPYGGWIDAEECSSDAVRSCNLDILYKHLLLLTSSDSANILGSKGFTVIFAKKMGEITTASHPFSAWYKWCGSAMPQLTELKVVQSSPKIHRVLYRHKFLTGNSSIRNLFPKQWAQEIAKKQTITTVCNIWILSQQSTLKAEEVGLFSFADFHTVNTCAGWYYKDMFLHYSKVIS